MGDATGGLAACRDRRVVSPDQTRPGTRVRAAAYGERVPVSEVAAAVLAVGDVIRVDDPQGHRVQRIVAVAGETVSLEMRPVGLAAAAPVRVTLAEHRVDRKLVA